ncbi:MAG TPA: efflux RND transporter periplasmic adaptor subunit [Thermoanaerobaculia bacterium]|nr:efflux RND transporter periplasmic adaptor subunit [Thermoanaerobaculia bacterium]
MRKRYATGLLALILPAVLASCAGDHPAAAKLEGGGAQGGSGNSQEQAQEQQTARRVRLAQAEAGRLSRTIAVSGTLAADEQAQVAIKVAGRIQQVHVDLGDRVRRGQPLARIIPTDQQLRVEQAETALQQARTRLGLPPGGPDRIVPPEETSVVRQAAANLKQATANRQRMSALLEQQLISRSDYDEVEAAYGVADARYQEALEEARTRQGVLAQRRSELEIARRQLADAVATAPFDGMIQERLVSMGDYVATGDPVAVLVRVNPLRLRLAVPEREAVGIRPGQEVRLTVEGDPGVHTGRVARVSPAISEENRTLMIEAEVPNPDARLRPGAFAKAEIVLEAEEPAVLVPTSAIVTFAGIDKVIGVEGGKAVEKPVKLGRRSGQQVEVLEGVTAGESVVVQPGNLTGGQPVEVQP